MSLGSNLRNRLIGESNILFNRHGVLDLPEDYGKCDEQTARKKAPVRCEHGHVFDLQVIQAPGNGTTSGLDALVESGKIGKFPAVVGQRTHEPVDARLPGSVGEAVERVQNKGACIARVGPILLLRRLVLGPGAVVCLLKHVAEAPDDHDGRKQCDPGCLGTSGPANALEIESEAEDVGANNLHNVVDDAIQGSRTDIEICAVDFGKVVGVEPIGGKEHGKQKDDVSIGEERLP